MENSFLKNWYVGHQNFLPKTYLGAVDENPFSFDVEKAKALLAEAGVENLELTVGVREAQERLEIAQSLQNTFAQAGITLNLEVGTGKQILGKYRARELDIYLGAWCNAPRAEISGYRQPKAPTALLIGAFFMDKSVVVSQLSNSLSQ